MYINIMNSAEQKYLLESTGDTVERVILDENYDKGYRLALRKRSKDEVKNILNHKTIWPGLDQLLYLMGYVYAKIGWWKIYWTDARDLDKSVIVFGPHNKKRDIWKWFAMQRKMRLSNPRVLSKKENWYINRSDIFVSLDRKNPKEDATKVGEEFRNSHSMHLIIGPEWSRFSNTRKTWFLRYAYEGNARIRPIIFDITNKRLVFSDPYRPSWDKKFDKQQMRLRYTKEAPDYEFKIQWE